MREYSAMWDDMWRKWPEMQADMYRGWMDTWARMASGGGGKEAEAGEKAWSEAQGFYRQWLDYVKEMAGRFAAPTVGLGPDTFMKLFQGADVYTRLYSMWMDMYQRYQEVVAEGKEMDPNAMRGVLDSWAGEYRELVDKVFAPAMPEPLRWITELYSGDMPLMAGGLFMQFWAPWQDFVRRVMERQQGMEKPSPEAAIEIYEDWRKAYEESYGRLLRAPVMGYYREAVEKFTHTMDSLNEFNMVLSKFYASIQSTGLEAVEKLQGQLAEMQADDAEAPASFREFYRLWWRTNEDIYVELFRTEEFSRLLGQLVDKGMHFRADFQAYVEEATKELPFPNRTEMDSLYKTLYGLRREVRRLSRELEETRARLQDMGGEG